MSSGLQGERTELAWLRTLLSAWASALIVMKIVFPLGIVAVIGPAAVTVIAWRRRRWLKEAVPPALPYEAAALVSAACVVVAVAAMFM
jgi:amino acid permease